MATTTYSINVRYNLQDNTSKGAGKIDKGIRKTTRSTLGLTRALKGLAVTVAAGFGFRAGKKWLIDYNAEMDAAKIKMATLTSLSLGGTWIENQKRANSLVRQFTKDAAVGVGTTQDYVELAGDITKPLLDAGASMKQLTELTKSGVTAAKTFGMAGDVAGRDIQQMLLGTVKSVDRLPRLLGVSAAAWNKMVREEGPTKTLAELEKVLNSKAMQDAAKAYGASWDGVTSTMEDNIQRTLGKVGLPLMKLLNAEVKKVNKFFDENPEKVQKFITDFSTALTDGFKVIKSVISFIVDNKDVLLSIAKAFIGFKIARGIGGMLAGAFDSMSKFGAGMGKAATGTATFSSRMTGAANKLQMFGTAVGVGIAAIKLAEGFLGRRQEKAQAKALTVSTIKLVTDDLTKKDILGMEKARKTGVFTDAKTSLKAKMTARSAVEEGFITAGKAKMSQPQIDFLRSQTEGLEKTGVFMIDEARNKELAKLVEAIERAAESTDKVANTLFQAQGGMASGFLLGMSKSFDMMAQPSEEFVGPTGAGTFTAGAGQKAKATRKNGDVNVHINTIKVVADDPDRFAMRMVGVFRNANTRAVSSRFGYPGSRPT